MAIRVSQSFVGFRRVSGLCWVVVAYFGNFLYAVR